MNKKSLISGVILLFIMLSTIYLARSVIHVYVVSGDSMEPLLEHGDVILALDLPNAQYTRGDIVVVDLEHMEEEEGYLVKEVLGIPGDSITSADGYLHINGEKTDIHSHNAVVFREVFLEEEEFYVVGSNMVESYDSRYFGPIQKNELIGKYYMTLRVQLPFVRRL